MDDFKEAPDEEDFNSALGSALEEEKNMFEESEEPDERELRAREVQEMATKWKTSDFNDDHKCEHTAYYGGFQLESAE